MPRFFFISSVSLTLAFFASVLFGGCQFAFRDGAHFYFPLYRYIQDELSSGRLPLWMPYENLGQPLLGNPAAGVFYPPKLLFFLPFDFTTIYQLFIVAHVFLAAATMYRLVRSLGQSEAAATLASIVYAFGGPVLFQHLNVIFLIGAAWFPELLRITLAMKKTNRFSYGLPVVLALMILGGDVQAAYHGAIAVLFLLGPKKSVGPLVLAFLLAAVQILPAWEYSRQSNRTQTGVPRSVWEIPFAKNADAIADGLLFRNLNRREHAQTTYNYSIAPWRTAEMIWPGAGGQQFPQNTRWFSACSWDKYVWVPSLYCGILGVVFAMIGCAKHRKIAAVFLLLLVGSFGSFGLGRLFPGLNVGDPVGGLYWLMNVLLPRYAQFRYPAKLLTVAAIPFAVLVGYGFDRWSARSRKIPRCVFVLLGLSISALLVLFCTPLWGMVAKNVPNCPMFGPFQESLAKNELTFSLIQTIVVLVVFAGIVRFAASPRFRAVLIVLLCGIEIFIANHGMVPTVSRREFTIQSPFLSKIAKSDTSPAPTRIYRYSIWYPPSFRAKTSPNRLAESVEFDRVSLWPKYTLEDRVSVVDVQGTMFLQTYLKRLEQIRSSAKGFEDRVARLGVEYVVLPNRKALDRSKATKIAAVPAKDVALWKIKDPKPIARTLAGEKPVRITVYEPNKIVLETDLTQPETVVLAEQYWPGWKARIENEDRSFTTKIFPIEEIFRGIDVPSGKCRITMTYEPLLFRLGLGLSLATGTAMLVFRRMRAVFMANDPAIVRENGNVSAM